MAAWLSWSSSKSHGGLVPLGMSGITLILQALRHTSECDPSFFFDLAHFCRNTYVYTGPTSKLADCVVTFHSLRHLASGAIV